MRTLYSRLAHRVIALSLVPLACFFLTSCQNLEDAKLTDRNTFVHYYEGANSREAAVAELTDDGGYIIAGTISYPRNRKIWVIKTDKLGLKQWEKIIDGGAASNIKEVGGAYILVGQTVEFDPFSAIEIATNSSRLIRLDANGNVTDDLTYKREINGLAVNYSANALTLDEQGNIITLGTFREPGKNEYAYVAALHATTLDTLWDKQYNYIVRDYENAKSVHCAGGKVLWGTSVLESQNNLNRSYLAIPVVLENSSFINSNYFGQNEPEIWLKIKDLQPSPWGYGAIGTYSKPDGTSKNVFFINVDLNGNFMEQTIRFYDANHAGSLAGAGVSDMEEEGNAITATRDGGYVLAASMQTSPIRGNGGKDIWMIKIDAFGDVQWNKLFGGAIDETVSSIRETPDGGLLICGTVTDPGGLSAIYLMKTDKNGELKD